MVDGRSSDYSNDSAKENNDINRPMGWNERLDDLQTRQASRDGQVDTNALAGEVVKLRKLLMESDKERSKLQKDVSFLVFVALT